MKKALNITITLVAIFLMVVGGYYMAELVKSMGVSMMTVKGMVGCCFTASLLVGGGWFLVCVGWFRVIDKLN